MKKYTRRTLVSNSPQIDSTNELLFQIEQLKAENELLTNVIYHIPGNVYWKGTDCRFLGGNKNMLEAVNLKSITEFSGTFNKQYLDPINADKIDEYDLEIMRTGKATDSIEELGLDKDGNVATYHSQKLPLYNHKKEVIGLVGISIDITERKNMETALRIAKEKAELASRAKTDFIANMSHDIKTPLAGIIGISELLCFRLQGENQELAESLLMSGRQLLSFLENCLEVSKVDNEEIPLEIEHFSLFETIDEIAAIFKPSIRSKELKLNIHLDNNLPEHLIGCRSGLYRVLLNLVANAVKFTQQGEINIFAALGKEISAREAVIKLTIQDTGIGIAPENQRIIFDRFTRLVPSYRGTYSGSGIGLYLVQSFVKKLGGEIFLQSELGKGSQFTVILPFQVPLLPSQEYQTTHVKPLTSNTDNLVDFFVFNSLRVLLIEDNMAAQRVTVALLAALNCHTDIAETGEKAILAFEANKYDLVLLDIGLPDIQGDKVAAHLRQKESASGNNTQRTPIIALTAHISPEISENYLKQGIDQVLSKPLMRSDAENIIVNLFQK